MGELFQVSENKQIISIPTKLLKPDVQAGNLYLFTKDSLFILNEKLNLMVSLNIANVELATFERTHLTYIDSSLLFNRLPNIVFNSDHNRMFYLLNYKTKQKWYYQFDGLPLKYGTMFEGKTKSLINKPIENHEIVSITWEYKFDKSDSSFWFPLEPYDYEVNTANSTAIDKYQFVKVNLHQQYKRVNVPYPKIHVRSNFPIDNPIFSLRNKWIDDSTMLYGFPSISTHYIFHTNSEKVDIIDSPYTLLPNELMNDSTSTYNIYNFYYDDFVINKGGDGYFRFAHSSNQDSAYSKQFVFWHKMDGSIIQLKSNLKDGLLTHAERDTLTFLKFSDNTNFLQSKYVIWKKYVVESIPASKK